MSISEDCGVEALHRRLDNVEGHVSVDDAVVLLGTEDPIELVLARAIGGHDRRGCVCRPALVGGVILFLGELSYPDGHFDGLSRFDGGHPVGVNTGLTGRKTHRKLPQNC